MAILREGVTGPEVTALQQRLKELGFNPGRIDGGFGPGTEAAVIAFQRSEGLLADGVVGPRTARALALSAAPEIPSVLPAVTPAVVSRMFPSTPLDNIKTHLPSVLGALVEPALTEKNMVLMALATIRAETEGFLPISEGRSRFNTSPGGHPFDLYDSRRDLGNQGPPDGDRFKGRGFIQLTGRSNYRVHGAAIGLGARLLEEPDLANDSQIASRLLASFLKSKERLIKEALLEGDLRAARRAVNGGSHGLDRFTDAYNLGDRLLPETLAAAAGGA
jgi:peptidoglycan L-alanyl-D-glutamate endopeptidase CwlK